MKRLSGAIGIVLAAGGLCFGVRDVCAEPVNLLPNGSFEFWTRFSTNYVREEAARLWDADPLVPVRWSDNHWNQRIRIERVDDGHGGKHAAAVSGGTRLTMSSLEVLPGPDYTFGVWIKGAGKVNIWVDGHALEGSQGLAGAKGDATGAWQRVGGVFRAPPHIRRVSLVIDVQGGRTLLDDAHIAAELDHPYDADAVLRDPYGRDEHTLFYTGFDEAQPAFRTEYPKLARVTDEKGGRFGRGLRLDPVCAATIPLALDRMPEEGTLEFWMGTDGPRRSTVISLPLDSSRALIAAGHTHWAWLDAAAGPKEQCWMPFEGGVSTANHLRAGDWKHMAITWDREAVRTYVDGVLMSTQVRKAIQWSGVPKFLQIGETHWMGYYQGVVDEIRLSKIRRYGPVVPKGAVYSPPPTLFAAPGAPGKAERTDGSDRSDGSDTAPTTEQVAAGRKALLSPLPAPETGAVVLEAAAARPIVEGGFCAIESNKVVQGLTVVSMDGQLGRMPDGINNAGVYWRLEDMEPGDYWIGVWYQSGDANREAPQATHTVLQVYLNGRMAQLATHSDPIQVKPGVFFAEAYVGESLALRPGDEIAVGRSHGGAVARVTLRRRPVTGPHRMATNFGGHQWIPYTALGVNVDAIFRLRDGQAVPYPDPNTSVERQAWSRDEVVDSNGQARVDFVFANPLSKPVTVAFTNGVRAYYFTEAVRDEGTLTIPAHGRVTRPVRFDWAKDEPAYMAFALLRGVKPPPVSAPREKGGLGWPEQEVYHYFDGHRHALPWPNPYAYRNLRRITLKTASDGYRKVMELDARANEKIWERAYTPALEPPMPPPAGLAFSPVNVPFAWHGNRIADMKPRPHGAYVRRRFVLPADLSGRSYRLTLSEATDEATVYVNGVKTGNLRGAHTPLICDITHAARPGTNELVIVVRDMVAIMNPAYVNTNAPTSNINYLDAPGLFGDQHIGMGSVQIESAPAVATEEAFVVTSVRKKTIAARLVVTNRGKQPVRARVKVVVLDGGKPALTVGERELELAPQAPVPLELETAWANPRLWGPTDPHLYTLAVEITDATTGGRLDWRRDRFGFRESWLDKAYIMFNGIPIRPKGMGLIRRLDPDGEFRMARGSRGDYTDEAGFPGGAYISGLQNSSSAHNVARDEFWAAAEKNSLTKMRLWWNRPSVIAWDLSNEWLCFLWHDHMRGAQRFKHLSDVVRGVDPTRWTFANAEGDLYGLLDNYSFHYMSPYFLAGANGGYGMHGHTPYLPDEEFWRPLDRHLTIGDKVPLCPHHSHTVLTIGEKVIMDSEFLWKCGDVMMPPGTTRWADEDAVLSPAVDASSGPIAWMWKTKIDGHRDLGVAPINPYSYHVGLQRGGYLDQTFIMPENQRRGFAGRTETRRYTVLNGIFRNSDMRLGWEFRSPGGKVIARGEFRKRLPSGGHETGEFSFKLPNVRQPAKHTLRATLEADGPSAGSGQGRFVSREEWDIEVWPDEPVKAGPTVRKVMLFERGTSNNQRPTSNVQRRELKTSEALTAAGVAFERMPDAGAPSTPPEQTLLVIGEEALDTNNVAYTASLGRFVAAGGRVLVLRQQVAPYGPGLKLEPREWASQVFLRQPNHPVLAGLDPLALHFWQPDRAVGLGAYAKPTSGNFVTLADSGSRVGMEWTHLLELYRGRGLWLLCQIPVAGRYNAEPMARELLARLVRYAGGAETYAQPTGTLAVVATEGGPVAKRLAEVGAKVGGQRPTSNIQRPTSNAVLVDAMAGRGLSAEDRAALGAALRGGATVVVAGATPADTNWLSELAGTPVSLSVTPYRMWEGRGQRRGWPRWTTGLSHLDHYWKRYDGGEGAGEQAQDPSNMLEPLQHYGVRAAGAVEHVFPGALLELAVGQGRLLLDQRRWWTGNAEVRTLANRQLSALLTALDVAASPPPPARSMPQAVEYRTVSLDAMANRALADDGQGGWTGEGPENDLRRFPTGRRNLYGVPYAIGAGTNRVVALRSARVAKAGELPEAVEIPLGFTVEALFFLHVATGSEDGEAVGQYTVAYEDGSASEISLVAGDNILDWTRPHQLTRERGTGSQVVWTGSSARHPLIAVTRMQWVNPRPDVAVSAVSFSNPEGRAMPVLFALTAAVPKGRVALTPEADAKGRDLLAKGKAALAAEQWAEARRLLTEALRNNPALDDAYRLLADAAERAHNEDWQLEAYRLWAGNGPRLPLPWNRIGEILERRKDLAGALEAYKKSLETEWNQPPIMEARRRLEAVKP
jgi:hypothetical protein